MTMPDRVPLEYSVARLIARDPARLFLSEHRDDARPDTLVHLVVSDVDAVVAEFGQPRRRTSVRMRARTS